MNSFRFVMQGINAEIARQTALVEAGEKVEQETLHFDPVSGRISSLRSKEEAHDYRYFPEPDLVPLVPTPEMMQAARAAGDLYVTSEVLRPADHKRLELREFRHKGESRRAPARCP